MLPSVMPDEWVVGHLADHGVEGGLAMGYRPDASQAYPNDHSYALPGCSRSEPRTAERFVCSRAISTERFLVLNGDVLLTLTYGR